MTVGGGLPFGHFQGIEAVGFSFGETGRGAFPGGAGSPFGRVQKADG